MKHEFIVDPFFQEQPSRFSIPRNPKPIQHPPPHHIPFKSKMEWTTHEDQRLKAAMAQHGRGRWKSIAETVQTKNRQQCAERWSQLSQSSLQRHAPWTKTEDLLLTSVVNRMEPTWPHRADWNRIGTMFGRSGPQCRRQYIFLLTQTSTHPCVAHPQPLYHPDMIAKKFQQLIS